jgi:hypothetical protein
MLSADLNLDGRVERFILVPGPGGTTLQIENTGGGVIDIEDVVPEGWDSSLGFTDEGLIELRVTSPDGITVWHAIAFSRQDYRIVRSLVRDRAGYLCDSLSGQDSDAAPPLGRAAVLGPQVAPDSC